MGNGLQDVKLTGINISTGPQDRLQALKLKGLDYYKLLWLYFGCCLGSNFNSFETKQREMLLNQRLTIVALT